MRVRIILTLIFASFALPGRAATIFGQPTTYQAAQTYWGLASGDFNGDGKIDLVAAGNAAVSHVFLGVGDGTFGAATVVDTTSISRGVTVADVNKDGKLDLIFSKNSGSVLVKFGNGDGTFQTGTSYTVAGAPYFAAVADINKDTNPDLVVANNSTSAICVLLGTGNGQFGAVTSYPTGGSTYSVAIADFDGDTNLDVVAASLNANVACFKGAGDGTFTSNGSVAAGTGGRHIIADDFNGDTKMDFAVANADTSDVEVAAGNGDGTFQTPVSYSTGAYARTIAYADFNGDGKRDFVVPCQQGARIDLLTGNAGGTFTADSNYPMTGAPHTAVAGDFNGDGKLDVAICNFQGGVYIYLNVFTGGGLVANSQDLRVSSGLPYDLTLAGTATPIRAFTFSLGASPTHGTITNFNSQTGAVTYTSNAGYFGPDSFTFTITDGTGNSPPADITLTVSPATTVNADDVSAVYTGSAQSISLTAHVNSAGGSVNEGTVTFQLKDGANNVGSAVTSPVANGTATNTYALAANLVPNVYAVNVVYSGGPTFGGSSDSSGHLTFSKATQTIDFTPPSNMAVDDPAQTLVATATSGLTVSFVVDDGPATVNGTSITADGRGTVTVRATQPGGQYYSAAPDITQTFDITGLAQTITFSTISNKTFGDPGFTLVASSDSGLPIAFSKTGPVTLNGDQVSITGAGSVTITASQIGDLSYEPATDVSQTFTVAKATQTITFAQLSDRRFGDPPLTLSATSTSNLPVSFVVVQGPANISGNVLTVTDAGLIAVQAVQAGNANYAAATAVQRIFTVTANLSPTITSPATATPSQALANAVIAFSAQGSDPEDDTLTYTWDFGDGTNATGPSVNHAYATIGTYNVTLTLTDGRSGSVTSTVTVFIMDRLTITKMGVKLIFNKTGGDSISVTGTLPLPPTFVFGGNPVDVNIGGIARSFTLDTKGKSAKAIDSIAVAKPKSGLAKYTIKFTKGSHAASLADEGLTNGNKSSASTPIIVSIRINNKGYLKVQPQLYTAKFGKSGATK